MGGTSAEREISLLSGEAILAALLSSGVNAVKIDTGEPFLNRLLTEPFDYAFIALHGRGGEDGVIQGTLETLNIPYTGSGVLGSALGMNKLQTKRIWATLGLRTAPYVVLDRSLFIGRGGVMLDSIPYPCVVKPAEEGSSIGTTRVSSADDLQAAYERAAEYQCAVLAEAWIEGEEYTVTILGDEALPSIRICPEKEFYDFEAKYQSDATQFFCPSGLSTQEEKRIQDLALNAFQAVGCHGWGRVDMIRDRAGDYWLLEVNTVPGMTSHSLVPMAAKEAGLSFEDLVISILAGARLLTKRGGGRIQNSGRGRSVGNIRNT
jgi:D-alanine-D-alanine ligase